MHFLEPIGYVTYEFALKTISLYFDLMFCLPGTALIAVLSCYLLPVR